jgi:hypothetical protein
MNVSQLAVYQLPSDMHTLQKRTTVPLYNRRRAINKRGTGAEGQRLARDTPPLHGRTFNTTTSCGLRTVVNTVTVADCKPDGPTSILKPLQNTTYVGPTLPADTSDEHHAAAATQRSTEPKRDIVRREGGDWSRVAYYTSAAPA